MVTVTRKELETLQKITGAYGSGVTPNGIGYLQYEGGVSRTVGQVKEPPARSRSASRPKIKPTAA